MRGVRRADGAIGFGATLLTAAALTLAPASATLAQSGATGNAPANAALPAESWVVTRTDGVALRSGAGMTWYVAAELDAGTMLRVDGEEDFWLRVEYPPGLRAVVKAGEGSLDADAGVVTLSRRSPLRAVNLADPFEEQSYKRIFAESPLPAGTTLEYVGPLQSRDGSLAGFVVVAPPGAMGFVSPEDVRPATPDEVLAHVGAPARAEAPAPEPAPAAPAGAPEDELVLDESNVDPPVETVSPMAEPTPARPAPAGGAPAGAAPAAQPSADDLDAAFERVMDQPIEDAEFERLIEEYEAYRARIDPAGPAAAMAFDGVDARIELLRIRAALQDSKRRLASLESGAEGATSEVARFVSQVGAARGYVAVGRLMPSTIYDGVRLPLMFRVQSVDGAAGRTLAYLLPGEEDLGLTGMLGSIVGVKGASETRSGMRVDVVRPESVDVLRSAN